MKTRRTNTQRLAAKIASLMETCNRTNGSKYLRFNDSLRAANYERLRDMAHEVHGNVAPDDFIYETMRDALEAIAEGVEDSIEFAESAAAYSTSDLTAWLASHNHRVDYVDEAAEEFGIKSGLYDMLRTGQHMELQSIFERTFQAINEWRK